MAEYINREEAIKELREVYENEYPTASGDFDEYASHDVPNILRNMKAADVQPVKHGRWIDIYEWAKMHDSIPSGMCLYYWCSECQEEQEKKSNFCPHCGARMDIIYEDDKIRAIKVTG